MALRFLSTKGISIGSYKTLIRSIYSFSLPLGGDSKVVGNNGIYELKIELDLRQDLVEMTRQ